MQRGILSMYKRFSKLSLCLKNHSVSSKSTSLCYNFPYNLNFPPFPSFSFLAPPPPPQLGNISLSLFCRALDHPRYSRFHGLPPDGSDCRRKLGPTEQYMFLAVLWLLQSGKIIILIITVNKKIQSTNNLLLSAVTGKFLPHLIQNKAYL
jgi:hypothetical protein